MFTGSPRSFGNDTTGNGMLYNYMPHATGTPGDFYGRSQTGKTGHKKKQKFIKSFICVLKINKNCLSFHFLGLKRKFKILLETQTFLPLNVSTINVWPVAIFFLLFRIIFFFWEFF